MHSPGVMAFVEQTVESMAAASRSDLLAHRKYGQARIETRHAQGRYRDNSEVHLVDPAWISIEFGHLTRPIAGGKGKRQWVDGLHILGKNLRKESRTSYLRKGRG